MFQLTNFEDKFVPPNLSNIFFECTYLNPVILKEYYSKLKHKFKNLKDITQLQEQIPEFGNYQGHLLYLFSMLAVHHFFTKH